MQSEKKKKSHRDSGVKVKVRLQVKEIREGTEISVDG